MFLVVTDANGNERFKVDLGRGAISNGNHVLQLPDGHFLAAVRMTSLRSSMQMSQGKSMSVSL